MIEERMKSAMQNKLPDVPDGFDARSDMQLLELTTPAKEKRMKLSIGWVIALVLVCILATGAVAATLNLFGLRDFISRYAGETGATVTEEFRESIQPENITAETDRAVYTVQESYYDGSSIRIIVSIQPRENELLLDDFYNADDDVWCIYDHVDPETTTIAEYARKNYNGRLASVEADINVWPNAAKMNEISPLPPRREFKMNEDGSVTVYYKWDVADYIKEREERDILLYMSYTQGTVSSEECRIDFDTVKTELTQIPLKIRFAGNEHYVYNKEMVFPDAGVTVTGVFMTVTPLDINCVLNYKITDNSKWFKARTEEAPLMFRFVRPDSTEPDGSKAFPVGFGGSYNTNSMDDGRIRATFSVSRDAYSDHYALQAYNRDLKMTFNTVEFDPQPWKEEELYKPHEPAEWLLDYQPEKPTKLTEENRSCEKNGIRLELVSSSVKDGMMDVVFSLEDTEGDRINENTEADITLDGEYVEPRYDAEQKKLFLTWSTETEYAVPDNQNYELEIRMLRNHRDIQVDLLPLLEKYGSQANLIHVREEDCDEEDSELKSELVLDYTNSLDIPLSEYVMLSGIGVEDGILRVQFHYPKHHYRIVQIFKDADSRTDEWYQGPNTIYCIPPYDCYAYLYETDEHDEGKLLREDVYGPLGIAWGSHDIDEEEDIRAFGQSYNIYEWNEFRFDMGSGLTETQKLTAEIHEEDPPIIGIWDIHVPAGMVNPAR